MGNLNRVLEIAQGYLGLNEYDGSHMVIVNKYNSYFGGYDLSSKDSWCDAFVSVVFNEAGMLNDIGGYECGCERHINLFKAKGIWNEDGKITPRQGDIILYNWDDKTQPNDGWADHIGIVESVSGTKITTIEGNYSNSVKRRTLYVGNGQIRGYAQPQYDGTDTPIIPIPIPTPTPTDGKIAEDGEWGQKTTYKAQQVFGTVQDGIVSGQLISCQKYHLNCLTSSWKYGYGYSNLIGAIQARVGVKVDGDCGYNTVCGIQRLVGAEIDGKMGSETVTKFQIWLNKQ